MSILWVQVCTTLPDHPKTTALAEALNLSCAKLDGNTAATGLLIRLWTWAIQVKPDGCLTGCSPKAFAQATRFRGKPEVLVDALISTGWLDQKDGELYLHDWEQYAGLFIDKMEKKKEQNRLAQQACRARKA